MSTFFSLQTHLEGEKIASERITIASSGYKGIIEGKQRNVGESMGMRMVAIKITQSITYWQDVDDYCNQIIELCRSRDRLGASKFAMVYAPNIAMDELERINLMRCLMNH